VNSNPYSVSKINAIGIIYSRSGIPMGLSRSILTDFPPSHERFFELVIPGVNPALVDLGRTELFLEAER